MFNGTLFRTRTQITPEYQQSPFLEFQTRTCWIETSLKDLLYAEIPEFMLVFCDNYHPHRGIGILIVVILGFHAPTYTAFDDSAAA